MEETLNGWVELEYKNIIKNVGIENLILSHVSPSLKIPDSLLGITVQQNSIQSQVDLHSQVLLLDPASTVELSPADAQKFKYLLFGGILGDDPPQDRTGQLRAMGFETRSLGSVQMTTDTAVLVAQQVLEFSIPLSRLQFIDFPEIKLGQKESVTLPFRYICDHDQPRLPKGMIEHLKIDNSVN